MMMSFIVLSETKSIYIVISYKWAHHLLFGLGTLRNG
jgi:hypothetical protein